jgi:hypothetical protein
MVEIEGLTDEQFKAVEEYIKTNCNRKALNITYITAIIGLSVSLVIMAASTVFFAWIENYFWGATIGSAMTCILVLIHSVTHYVRWQLDK